MGKKNTGSNSRSKRETEITGCSIPEIKETARSFFVQNSVMVLPPQKFIGLIIQERFFGLQVPFFDSFCQKITDSLIKLSNLAGRWQSFADDSQGFATRRGAVRIRPLRGSASRL